MPQIGGANENWMFYIGGGIGACMILATIIVLVILIARKIIIIPGINDKKDDTQTNQTNQSS